MVKLCGRMHVHMDRQNSYYIDVLFIAAYHSYYGMCSGKYLYEYL